MMSEKKIKISVIVAVYNQEKYIGRCLRSLIRQSFEKNDYEIIVVNDGSYDKTDYALSLFHGDIIKIDHPKNKGLPSAINSALAIARGEYIVRVDSDDYVNKFFLRILSVYLDMNTAAAVCCDYLLVDENENVISKVSAIDEPIACGIMYRKQAIDHIGNMNENFLLNEEKEYRRRFEKHYQIEHVKLPLYRYRKHQDNMTNNKLKKNKYDLLLNSSSA